MRQFGFLMLLAVFFTCSALPALAQEQNICVPEEPTKINVTPSSAEVKFDYSLDLAGLQRIQSDTLNPFGFHQKTQTRGLMRGAISIDGPNIKFGLKRVGRQGEFVCAWFDQIDIEIAIEPEIVIAKEVASDPCMHKMTREHELEHVMIDRRIVNKYAREMGEKVNAALKQRGYSAGPYALEEQDQLLESMQRTVVQVLDLEQQKMAIERTEKQRDLDSLQEYKRITLACPGFRSHGP